MQFHWMINLHKNQIDTPLNLHVDPCSLWAYLLLKLKVAKSRDFFGLYIL